MRGIWLHIPTLVNALEMGSSVLALWILLRFAWWRIASWVRFRDFFRLAFTPSFRGGPLDLVVAMIVLFTGALIRRETVWEMLVFDNPLRLWQMLGGAILSVLGFLCLIRVTAERHDWATRWLPLGLTFVLIFALVSSLRGIF